MEKKEVFKCIAGRIPVMFRGIRLIPVGAGFKVKNGKTERFVYCIEENAKVDITSHIKVKAALLKEIEDKSIYKTTDITHTLSEKDLLELDRIADYVDAEIERKKIQRIREAYNV